MFQQGQTIYCKKATYKIIQFVGSGTGGNVYKAQDEKTKKFVALKQQMLIQSKEKEVIETLQQHKFVHVVNILDLDEKIDQVSQQILIMDLADGNFVEYWNREKHNFDLNKKLQYFLQIVKGVEELHNLKLIHRDIKLENVVYNQTSYNYVHLKICDTGLIRNNIKNPLKTTQIGTPCYMAPEQLNDQQYNEKVDIWALGMVLYEMISGNTLIQGLTVENALTNLQRICQETIDIYLQNLEIQHKTPVITEILKKMVHIKSDQRISVKELKLQLQKILNIQNQFQFQVQNNNDQKWQVVPKPFQKIQQNNLIQVNDEQNKIPLKLEEEEKIISSNKIFKPDSQKEFQNPLIPTTFNFKREVNPQIIDFVQQKDKFQVQGYDFNNEFIMLEQNINNFIKEINDSANLDLYPTNKNLLVEFKNQFIIFSKTLGEIKEMKLNTLNISIIQQRIEIMKATLDQYKQKQIEIVEVKNKQLELIESDIKNLVQQINKTQQKLIQFEFIQITLIENNVYDQKFQKIQNKLQSFQNQIQSQILDDKQIKQIEDKLKKYKDYTENIEVSINKLCNLKQVKIEKISDIDQKIQKINIKFWSWLEYLDQYQKEYKNDEELQKKAIEIFQNLEKQQSVMADILQLRQSSQKNPQELQLLEEINKIINEQKNQLEILQGLLDDIKFNLLQQGKEILKYLTQFRDLENKKKNIQVNDEIYHVNQLEGVKKQLSDLDEDLMKNMDQLEQFLNNQQSQNFEQQNYKRRLILQNIVITSKSFLFERYLKRVQSYYEQYQDQENSFLEHIDIFKQLFTDLKSIYPIKENKIYQNNEMKVEEMINKFKNKLKQQDKINEIIQFHYFYDCTSNWNQRLIFMLEAYEEIIANHISQRNRITINPIFKNTEIKKQYFSKEECNNLDLMKLKFFYEQRNSIINQVKQSL